MKISKSKALKLINQKISQFNDILNKANYENRYDEAYQLAFNATVTLIAQVSAQKAKEFKLVTSSNFAGGCSPLRELAGYKEHLRACIDELEIYKKYISAFWEDDVPARALPKEMPIGEVKPSKIPCPVCGKTFSTNSEMETHRDTIHYELHE